MAICFRLQQILIFIALSTNYCHTIIAASGSDSSTATKLEPATTEKELLVESESKDGKLEIIKQIKKVNTDGSYTIGYEADDGSFKIESRDVLGNIKGTYGYVDENGHIKRVSYSTSNTSDLIARAPVAPQPPPPPPLSVVQRIPAAASRLNRTDGVSSGRYRVRHHISTTRLPQANAEANSATKPDPIYASTTPRVLLQGRPLLRSTAASSVNQKSEGQLVRPEVRPTDEPLYRRLGLNADADDVKSNILRRQLIHEKNNGYDSQQQPQNIFNYQHDATDVYSGSMTTGTPRPLFTTTIRNRPLISTTAPPIILARPALNPSTTQRYTHHFDRSQMPTADINSATPTTTASESGGVTSTTVVPIVQIPATNRHQNSDPLVAVRHPFQRGGTVLVPLSQLQSNGGRILIDEPPAGYYVQPQKASPPDYSANHVQRMVPSPPMPHPTQFRPFPVQVDENGYIRQVHHAIRESHINGDGIDQISPPVSTRDFQKLLQLLIVRQARLERISALTSDPRRYPEQYQLQQLPQRYHHHQRPPPQYILQRLPAAAEEDTPAHGPIQFVPTTTAISTPSEPQRVPLYDSAYAPNRRVTRVLSSPGPTVNRIAELAISKNTEATNSEEYLPPHIREMLLLRMLQLAINPALPLDDDDFHGEPTTPSAVYTKRPTPIRNVEILGEEPAEASNRGRSNARSKRYTWDEDIASDLISSYI